MDEITLMDKLLYSNEVITYLLNVSKTIGIEQVLLCLLKLTASMNYLRTMVSSLYLKLYLGSYVVPRLALVEHLQQF